MLKPENTRERVILELGNLLLMNVELAQRVVDLENALNAAKASPPPSEASQENVLPLSKTPSKNG